MRKDTSILSREEISIKKLMVIIITLSSIYYTTFCDNSQPQTDSLSVILSSDDGQQIIYSSNPDQRLSPAEFTKMAVCLLVSQESDTSKQVTVTENMQRYMSENDSTISPVTGESLSIKTLMEACLIASSDNAALLLALYAGNGNIDPFVKKLNSMADSLGCTDTNFTNVTGNYDENQYTTANDSLKIFKKAYDTAEINEIMKKPKTTVYFKGNEKDVFSKNHLVHTHFETKYYYYYAQGGQTGYTDKHGYNLAAFAEKNNMRLLCIVLGGNRKDKNISSFTDAKKLFSYAFSNFKTTTAVKLNEPISEVAVINGRNKSYTVVEAQNGFKIALKSGDEISEVERKLSLPDSLSAPVKKGEVVGKIYFLYEGREAGSVNLVTTEDISYFPFENILKFLSNRYILYMLGFSVLILSLFRAKSKSQKVSRRSRTQQKINSDV